MNLVSLLRVSATVLSGLVMALGFRAMRDGSHCASDEDQWAVIAEQVAHGVDWPISGPLHFAVVRAVTHSSELDPPQALAFVGTLSVPVLLALTAYSYGQLGVKKPTELLIFLACSTYFLTPLLESRPQQWGQVLVLTGMVFSWRAIHGLMSWLPYAFILTLVAGVHILSFAILCAASLVAWTLLYAMNQTTARPLLKLTLCAIPASIIFLMPDGPYSSMIRDVRVNHFQIVPNWSHVVPGIVALAFAVVVTLGLIRRFARQFITLILSTLNNHPVLVWTGVSLLSVSSLGVQAAILPNEAWAPYGNSIVLFLSSQMGNIFFLGLAVTGLESARQTHASGHDQTLIQATTILILSVSIIGVAALMASLWMLHTNWLLRVLNYLCLFMAPFAAIGFDKIKMTWGKWSIWLAAVVISFISLFRPTALFNC